LDNFNLKLSSNSYSSDYPTLVLGDVILPGSTFVRKICPCFWEEAFKSLIKPFVFHSEWVQKEVPQLGHKRFDSFPGLF